MNLSEKQLRQVADDVNVLEELLEREKLALSNPPTDKFYEIASQKQDLLNRLAAYGLDGSTVSVLGADTLEALRRCRDLNHENNLLVNQKLKVIRQINTIYRQQISNHTVALYDQLGKMVHGGNHRFVTEI